jgi:hypothetical protein
MRKIGCALATGCALAEGPAERAEVLGPADGSLVATVGAPPERVAKNTTAAAMAPVARTPNVTAAAACERRAAGAVGCDVGRLRSASGAGGFHGTAVSTVVPRS